MKNWPYWIKGGLLAIPLSIIIVPLSFFITYRFGADEDATQQLLAPGLLGVVMSLGMRGTPAGTEEAIITWIIASLIFALRVFIMGAIIGALYGVFAKRNKRKMFFIGLVAVYIGLLGALSYRFHNVSAVYYSVSSPKDCASAFKKGIVNFDENRCYLDLAERKQDVHICDNIKNPSVAVESPEGFRVRCYQDVAYAAKDPSVCEIVPGGLSERDDCYARLSLCDKISSGNGDYCYTQRASFGNDISSCNLVKNKDECYSQAAWWRKDFTLCAKIQDQEKKQQCDDSTYFYRAREEKNPLLCDQIKDANEKTKCHSYLER